MHLVTRRAVVGVFVLLEACVAVQGLERGCAEARALLFLGCRCLSRIAAFLRGFLSFQLSLFIMDLFIQFVQVLKFEQLR